MRLRHFSSTCAVRIEDFEGWWYSGCRSSCSGSPLAAQAWCPVLGSIPGNCRPFHFPLFLPQNI